MKPLDPKAFWLFFVQSVSAWLKIIIFLFILYFVTIIPKIIILKSIAKGGKGNMGLFSSFSLPDWSWIVFVALIILCFISAKLKYKFYRYDLTDTDFRKEQGFITKRYVTIPYDRIQNVDIYRGVWSRIFGLSDLQIETAGVGGVVGRYGTTMGAEGRLLGVSKEMAEQLRDKLVLRSNKAKNQGL